MFGRNRLTRRGQSLGARCGLGGSLMFVFVGLAQHVQAQASPEVEVGVAFGPTSVEEFALDDWGVGLLARLQLRRIGVEFAAHHLGGATPVSAPIASDGQPSDVSIGSRHLLVSYEFPLGVVSMRPALGVTWSERTQFGPAGGRPRGAHTEPAIAMTLGGPVLRTERLVLSLEVMGRVFPTFAQSHSRNLAAFQLVLSRPDR